MRLAKLTLGDIRFQWRHGFYLLYAGLTLVYLLLLGALPAPAKGTAAAILLFSDPAAMGLFFMGAVVLLEKSQRVLPALATSPVRVWEYIAAKLLAFLFISLLVALALGIAAGGKNLVGALVGTGATSLLLSLLGLVAAARARSLNGFILAVVPLSLLAVLPPVLWLLRPQIGWLRWYPLSLCMAWLTGHTTYPVREALVVLAAFALLFWLAHGRVKAMLQSLGGVKL